MYGLISDDYLKHYGVKGMKWGVRHDYVPIGRKRANSVLNKSSNHKMSSRTKKYIKRGAIAAGLALGVVGGVYLYKSGNFNKVADLGKRALADMYKGNSISNDLKFGKSSKQIDMKMLKSINGQNFNLPDGGGQRNCFHTTTAYILNSVFGQSRTAKPFSGVDEISGLKSGRDWHLYDSIFDGIRHIEYRNNGGSATLDKSILDMRKGSTGILCISDSKDHRHAMIFEKTRKGIVTLVDPQSGLVKEVDNNVVSQFNSGYTVHRIMDFNNASIKPDAENILKYIVK